MPDITANAPDGTKHVFPDGTDPAVIDRVMKQYITGGQTVGAPTQPQAQPSTAKTVGREGALGFFSGMGIPETQHPVQDLFKGLLDQAGTMMGGKAWQGKDPYGLEALKATPPAALARGGYSALQDIYGGGVRGGISPDIGQVSHGVGSALGTATMLKLLGGDKSNAEALAKNVSEGGRLLNQADAINQAQVQVVNNHVRGPLARLDAAVSDEIGQHVKASVDADRAQMQASGAQVGLVSGAKALDAAHAKLGSMGGMAVPTNISGLLTEAARPMSLNEAKSLTTDVGRTAAALTRQGNLRQAAVLNELYNGLHEATQARANELGTGKSWKQYIDLTRSYKGLQEGLAGELTDEPVHAKVMNKLIDPTRGTEWNELRDELAKRGIDTTQFEKARDYAKQMSDLVQTTSNLFVGKLRAIIRHPFTAGPAAIGAGEVGHLSGIPGLGFVLPMIAAGKVAGLLDSAAVAKLVKEIGANVAPEASRAGEALPPPMKPQAGATPAPGGPKGGINPKGYEQSMKPVDLADQISAIQTNTRDLKEQMRVASSLYSDEEIQQAEQRVAENDRLVKELQAALKGRKKK